MPPVLESILRFLSRDLTGNSWVRELSHPYFGKMTFFGFKKEPSKSYWEAEVSLPGSNERIGVTMAGTPDGPTPEEEQFCRRTVSDLDGLFEKCRPAFEPTYLSWVKKPFPSNWREAFKLDGFTIPESGNPAKPWEITYYVQPAGHWFTAVLERDVAIRTDVDG